MRQRGSGVRDAWLDEASRRLCRATQSTMTGVAVAEQVIWGIHIALVHGRTPIDQGHVALGWGEMGDLAKIAPYRDAYKAAYASTYPAAKPGNVAASAGALFRFAKATLPVW